MTLKVLCILGKNCPAFLRNGSLGDLMSGRVVAARHAEHVNMCRSCMIFCRRCSTTSNSCPDTRLVGNAAHKSPDLSRARAAGFLS